MQVDEDDVNKAQKQVQNKEKNNPRGPGEKITSRKRVRGGQTPPPSIPPEGPSAPVVPEVTGTASACNGGSRNADEYNSDATEST